MLCTHNMQVSPQKNPQMVQWDTQNQFLQERHGSKMEAQKEIIIVGLHHDDDGFELLSWAISIAARPGDIVIAFYLKNNGAKVENLIGNCQKGSAQEQEALNSQLKVLRDICDAKQVQMDIRFAISGNEELELIEEASSTLATLLVVSSKGPHKLWRSQKKGNSLARRAPTGCSVVVVKDHKVVFYKENAAKERKDISFYSQELHQGTSTRKGLSNPIFSLQRQFSCTSSALWSQAKDSFDFDAEIMNGSKVWPVFSVESSPRGVLDTLGLSSESDLSSPLSSCSGLSHSLSRKGLLSRGSSQADLDDDMYSYRSENSSSIWKHGIQRSSTFPPASRLKKFSGPLDCASMRSSVKCYVNSLWSTESMGHESSDASNLTQRSWRCFSYEELAAATNNFSSDNVVGKGGHAQVYKGRLLDGRLVAIKRLVRGDSEDAQERDFLTELGIIGHVSHPNTVPLIGFCVEEGLHLIFNFSSHGSLAELLHGVSIPVLDWPLRYKIAIGTARGLHYLHTGCPRRIIHRDIKASNILLGPDFEPQISDFGLAKWLPEQWTQLNVSPVEGTFGYLAPEYFMHGIVNEKTDVFAFGVLLLELITGRLPIDDSQQSLVMWAKPLLESSRIEDLVDPQLAGEYHSQEMQAMVMAASLCVQPSDVCRPCMEQVLQILTNDQSDTQAIDSYSMPLCQSDYFQDSLSDEEYSPSNYLSDLSRHREVALQF